MLLSLGEDAAAQESGRAGGHRNAEENLPEKMARGCTSLRMAQLPSLPAKPKWGKISGRPWPKPLPMNFAATPRPSGW